MYGSKNGNFAGEFLVKVACVGGRTNLWKEWRWNAFVIDIFKVDGAEIGMFHDFKSISFSRSKASFRFTSKQLRLEQTSTRNYLLKD